MDIQQLVNFQVLARVANVTKAAQELSLTQSALSKSIARLEEEMGVPLFSRNQRGVALNPFGKEFLAHAERMIQEMENAHKKINEMVDPAKGVISIGFIPTLRPIFIPNLIRIFLEEAPNVQFKLTQGATLKVIQQLVAGEVDLVFSSSQSTIQRIKTYPLIREKLMLIVPKSHRFANRKDIRLEEIADEAFVHYQADLTLRSVIDNFCKEAGFLPKVAIEGSEDEIIAGLVEANCGVAIIPQTSNLDKKNVSVLSITEPICERTIEMVWREEGYMAPIVERLRQFVIDHISVLETKYEDQNEAN